jgi:hypothetical protein
MKKKSARESGAETPDATAEKLLAQFWGEPGTWFVRTGKRMTVFEPAGGCGDDAIPICEVVEDLASDSAVLVQAARRRIEVIFAPESHNVVGIALTRFIAGSGK